MVIEHKSDWLGTTESFKQHLEQSVVSVAVFPDTRRLWTDLIGL